MIPYVLTNQIICKFRRADGLEEANGALRRTIAAGIQNKEEPAIRMKVPVTTHTPHFLQHTRSEPHCHMY